MLTKKYCLALDLKKDEQLIAEYKLHHKNVWPGIINSIKDSGIINMDIYCTGNRLFMIIEAVADFSFEKKSLADAANNEVREWENLMGKFQQTLPWTTAGQKWILMENIFQLP